MHQQHRKCIFSTIFINEELSLASGLLHRVPEELGWNISIYSTIKTRFSMQQNWENYKTHNVRRHVPIGVVDIKVQSHPDGL